MKELRERKIPFTIRRYLPDGRYHSLYLLKLLLLLLLVLFPFFSISASWLSCGINQLRRLGSRWIDRGRLLEKTSRRWLKCLCPIADVLCLYRVCERTGVLPFKNHVPDLSTFPAGWEVLKTQNLPWTQIRIVFVGLYFTHAYGCHTIGLGRARLVFNEARAWLVTKSWVKGSSWFGSTYCHPYWGL